MLYLPWPALSNFEFPQNWNITIEIASNHAVFHRRQFVMWIDIVEKAKTEEMEQKNY
jgi:hypothetical protein